MSQIAVPIHVGINSPAHWDEVEAQQKALGDDGARSFMELRRPSLAHPIPEWEELGIDARWVGFDTAECAAALEPNIFSGRGAQEFDRFRQGAARRGEVAVVVSLIGQRDVTERSVLFRGDGSVAIGGGSYTSVVSERLGEGARVHAAEELSPADSQLARRLMTCNPAPFWRGLSLSGSELHSTFGIERHAAEGLLKPILVSELGEPVAAVWLSPDGVERRYIVPVETPWALLLPWLLEQALPELVPGAMRRARRHLDSDVSMMTLQERKLQSDLAVLEARYLAQRQTLTDQLTDAQRAAAALRDGLLYGTGKQLEAGVRFVLAFAGIEVLDLDEWLGGTKNADLLCTYGGRSRVVEVKSSSGSAPERAYQDLMRHLREWPSLQGAVPVDGGVLVINHDLRSHPLERPPRPYARPEFLAAQTEPVVTTIELFNAWRHDDEQAIRQLIFGAAVDAQVSLVEDSSCDLTSGQASPSSPRRRWFGNRGR